MSKREESLLWRQGSIRNSLVIKRNSILDIKSLPLLNLEMKDLEKKEVLEKIEDQGKIEDQENTEKVVVEAKGDIMIQYQANIKEKIE